MGKLKSKPEFNIFRNSGMNEEVKEELEEFSDENDQAQYLDELKNGPKEIPTYYENSEDDDEISEN